MIVGWSSGIFVCVLVGTINVGVRDAVGEEVHVAVAVNVFVGVEVATNLANASAVCAAAVLRLENARSGMSPASITIGVERVGSESAIAEVAQNRLNPNRLAAKIHKRPA